MLRLLPDVLRADELRLDRARLEDDALADLLGVLRLDAVRDDPAVLFLADAVFADLARLAAVVLVPVAPLLRGDALALLLRLDAVDFEAAALRVPLLLLDDVALRDLAGVLRALLARFAVPLLFDAAPLFRAAGLLADVARLFDAAADLAFEAVVLDFEEVLRDFAALVRPDALPDVLLAPDCLLAEEVLRPDADFVLPEAVFVELDEDFFDLATAFFSLSSSEQSQSALLEERLFRAELPVFEA